MRHIDVLSWVATCTIFACSSSSSPSNATPADTTQGGQTDAGTTPEAGANDTGASSAPGVRIVGREDDSDPAGPRIAWPGVRVIARFEGTQMSVSLEEANGSMGGTSSYDVLVDGNVQPAPLVTTAGTNDYVVATGLPSGTHTIELVKRAEAEWGATQFLSYSFPGGKLLAPPAPRKHKIEFLTESGMNGYGVAGTNPCPGGAPADSHDARISAPMLLGDAVDADVSLLGYSGKGVVRNLDPADPDTFEHLYARALPESDNSVWDPKRFATDVVVIMLGGTDYTEAPYPSLADFTAGVERLVKLTRAGSPNAVVFLGVGPQISDDYPTDAKAHTTMRAAFDAVVAQHAAAGDKNVVAFEMRPADPANLTACLEHPNAAMHRAMAAELAGIIKPRMGW